MRRIHIPSSATLYIYIILVVVAVFTRFVNLTWGFPYPLHPDERNMADAISQLQCLSFTSECFNPHFFAYGQVSLYLGYIAAQFIHVLRGSSNLMISFDDSVIALRVLSGLASLGTIVILLKSLELLVKKPTSFSLKVLAILLFIFSPGLIQFAHFGTTESLLMLCYTVLIYVGFLILRNKISLSVFLWLSGILVGLGIGIKVSSVIFIVPLFLLLMIVTWTHHKSYVVVLQNLIRFLFVICLFTVLSSPQTLLHMSDFLGSFQYESSVGTGLDVFYTRQFIDTVPGVFQIFAIFPYALGLGAFFMAIAGFFILPKNRLGMFLRFSIVFFFVINAGLFTKWTRFMAPLFPLLLLCSSYASILFCEWLKKNASPLFFRVVLIVMTLVLLVPGMAFLSIYQIQDSRFQASNWMFQNIPEQSLILSEGGNVVNLPLPSPGSLPLRIPNYRVVSFDFYSVEDSMSAQEQLRKVIGIADYIIVPSRRVYANYTCYRPLGERFDTTEQLIHFEGYCHRLEEKYPVLNDYYKRLFNGEMGFQEIHIFSSFPSLTIAGHTLLKFPDEFAEETFSVFDHPVVRIYKRMSVK